MIYGSVFSGIEAVSVAWEPLGWQAAWFAEIEPYACAVLAQRWPAIQNVGDVTKIAPRILSGELTAPDIFVGGSPCQAYSIAGLRGGLSDQRGQLTLAYVELANAIDKKRIEDGKEPAIIVWENVPGVLSSKDNAFGHFLAGLAGESEALQPSGGKWSNAGFVSGPQRDIAWCVRDAQYFGVAQRRRRVFVVASARNGFNPAAVLFELGCVRGNTAPSRAPGANTSALTANGVGVRGADDNQAQAGHLIAHSPPSLAYGGGRTSGPREIAACLTAKGQRNDFDVETFALAFPERMSGTQAASTEDLSPALMAANPTAIAFHSKDHGADAAIDLAPTLRASGGTTSHNNAGAPPAIAYCLQHAQIGRNDAAGPQGKGWQEDVSFTLDSRTSADAVAFAENSRGEIRLQNGDGSIVGALSTGGGKPGQGTPGIIESSAPAFMQVRRITPRECERLQAFPDDYTLVAYGRVVSPEKMDKDFAKYLMRGGRMTFDECCAAAADGPRYRALGNSMCVNVMRWLGEQIAAQVVSPAAVNPYCAALDGIRNKPTHELKEIGDQWRTPDPEWWGMNALYGPFSLDLFAAADNAKCPDYYTAEDNALAQDWSERLQSLGGAAYGNPPFSREQFYNEIPITGMANVMDHARAMRAKGGRYVLLVKAAMSEGWWPEDANRIIFIKGRFSFVPPTWYRPKDKTQRPSSAGFAMAIVIFDKTWRGSPIEYISRDELRASGRVLLALVDHRSKEMFNPKCNNI